MVIVKKNMSRFLYIFAFGIFLNVSYISGYSPVTASMSIMDVIRHDTNICSTPSFLYNSSYTSECTKIKYPSSELQNISLNNVKTFLCLGLYDISYRICYLASRNDGKLKIDENQFHLQLKQIQSHNDSLKFCEQLQSVKYPPLYNKTQLQVTKLINELMKRSRCEKICFDYYDKLDPLCSIWAWAAQLLMLEKTTNHQQNSTLQDSHLNISLIKDGKSNQTPTKTQTAKQTQEMGGKSKLEFIQSNQEKQAASHKSELESIQTDQEVHLDSHKSEPETIEIDLSKSKETLLSGKTNDFSDINSDHVLNITSKNNDKTQASSNGLSDSKTLEQKKIDDSKTISKSSAVVEPYESLNTKPETSLDNPNKNIEDTETLVDNPTDPKNKESEHSKKTGSSNSETLSKNIDDGMDNINLNDNDDSNEDILDTINFDPNLPKSSKIKDTVPRYPGTRTEDDSHFFAYFMVITLLCVGGYVGYHNKQKILAIVLEGRRSRGGRGRRRPSTASYRKLDCTLEEAVTSQCNSNVTHVIY